MGVVTTTTHRPLFLAFLLTFLCPALRKAPLWQCQCIPDERKEPGKGFCFSATFSPSLSWLPWSTWYLKPQNGEAVEVFLRDTLYTVSTVYPVLSPVGPSTEFQNPSTHSRPCLNSGQKQKGHEKEHLLGRGGREERGQSDKFSFIFLSEGSTYRQRANLGSRGKKVLGTILHLYNQILSLLFLAKQNKTKHVL